MGPTRSRCAFDGENPMYVLYSFCSPWKYNSLISQILINGNPKIFPFYWILRFDISWFPLIFFHDSLTDYFWLMPLMEFLLLLSNLLKSLILSLFCLKLEPGLNVTCTMIMFVRDQPLWINSGQRMVRDRSRAASESWKFFVLHNSSSTYDGC